MPETKPQEFTLGTPVVEPPSEVAAKTVPLPSQGVAYDFSATEIAEVGKQLAAAMESEGFHPVVLFGNAASGKTSLLLSLLSLIKTDISLECGFFLADPIIGTSTPYGRYLKSQAEQFFERKTQDFIEGRASPKTNIDYPFFVPVIFRPKGKKEIKFAFMESNGEWYRPDRTGDKMFPALKKQIEDFLRQYQKGVSFIHLVPYTQSAVRETAVDKSQDRQQLADASLAITGALHAYETVRVDKSRDRHLMLVTKWDAHKVDGMSLLEVLTESSDDVLDFVNQHYSQAFALYQGLGLRRDQTGLAVYCSGLMTGQDVLSLSIDNEHRPAVLKFPKKLWTWLYRHASEESGETGDDPFPQPALRRPRWLQAILDWLDRTF